MNLKCDILVSNICAFKCNSCLYIKVKWHIVKDVPNTMLRHIQLVTSVGAPYDE
jgi:hypothetical protein